MAQQKIFKPTNNSVDFLFHPKSFAILGLNQDLLSQFQSKSRWDIDSRLDMAHDHKLLFPPDLDAKKFLLSDTNTESYWSYHYPKFHFIEKQQREDIIAKTLNGFDLSMASKLLLEQLKIEDIDHVYVLYFDRFGHAFIAQLDISTPLDDIIKLLLNVAYSGAFYDEWVDPTDYVRPTIVYHHLESPWGNFAENGNKDSQTDSQSELIDSELNQSVQNNEVEDSRPQYYQSASEEAFYKNRDLSRGKFIQFRNSILQKSDDADVILMLKTIEITESQVGFFKILNLLFQSVAAQHPNIARALNPLLADFAVLENQGISRMKLYRFANKIEFLDFNITLDFKPLDMAIYRLYLTYAEGISFKNRSKYKSEVVEYYLSCSNRTNELDLTERIQNMFTLSEDRAPLDQAISRINAAFKKNFAPEIAYQYMITGTRGENYGIQINRDLLEIV